MKNQDVYNLSQSLANVGNLSGIKFVYGIARNSVRVKLLVNAMIETIKESEKYQEFIQKRVELAIKHSKKDEKGNPVIIFEGKQSRYDIADQVVFDKELETLKEEYKEAIDEQKKKEDAFNEFLKEESDFEPYMIDYADIPENITAAQMSGIINLIKEEVK
jgi:hypothetical protein